ncbi:protein BTG3-like [Scleropages formosus]|uniref:Protein BTG3-like n=1 Tax=Scleropages formosus TaxID=113540 RepID=A0A0N8JV65_SCLFO|nr:protein BTG3-like [Scleropages formosus]
MRTEVRAAVDFLSNLAQRRGGVDQVRARRFAEKLEELLCEKYASHWYPENPGRGQAFRCIRINRSGPLDGSVLRACEESDLSPAELGLPPEITVWIDPEEVCVRLKEDQSFFKLHFEKQVMMGEGYEGPWKTEGSVSSECHSASSSDCESVVSSDSEEQGKEAASVGEPRQSEEEDELCLHASGPRVRELRQSGSGRLPQWCRNLGRLARWMETTWREGSECSSGSWSHWTC